MTQFWKVVPPWGDIYQIVWQNFARDYALGTYLPLWLTLFWQGFTPWWDIFHVDWHKFCKWYLLGYIWHICWFPFVPYIPHWMSKIRQVVAPLDCRCYMGNFYSGQICHTWCHTLFQFIILRGLFLKQFCTFWLFSFRFSLWHCETFGALKCLCKSDMILKQHPIWHKIVPHCIDRLWFPPIVW